MGDELNSFGDADINNLIVHSLDCRHASKEIKRSDDDLSNVIRSEIFSLFTNAKTLIIDTTYFDDSFSFSLMALLNVIVGSNLDQIIIKSTEYDDDDSDDEDATGLSYCWLKSVWNS